jgi:hypothetical protein
MTFTPSLINIYECLAVSNSMQAHTDTVTLTLPVPSSLLLIKPCFVNSLSSRGRRNVSD